MSWRGPRLCYARSSCAAAQATQTFRYASVGVLHAGGLARVNWSMQESSV